MEALFAAMAEAGRAVEEVEERSFSEYIVR
jgi:hypothetical protein